MLTVPVARPVPAGRRAPRWGVAVPAAATLVLLTACTLPALPPGAPGAASPAVGTPAAADRPAADPTAPEPPAAPDVGHVRSGVAVASGPVTLWVRPDATTSVAVVSKPDGSATFDVALAGTAAGTPASRPATATVHIAAPDGMTLEVLADSSVLVRDASGGAVGGLAPLDPAAVGLDARYQPLSPELLAMEIRLDGARPAPGATVSGWLGSETIHSLDWGHREGGRSLAVEPTAWARAGGRSAEEVLRATLAALEPETDSATMFEQLVCHATFAPDKHTWNLEPWRPDVGAVDVILAGCNPV